MDDPLEAARAERAAVSVRRVQDLGYGEFVSLIGPSGCGKSTLLRIIGDLIEPSGGKVVVNGKPARQARIDRDYGIVFQDPVLYDWRSVAKNIALPLELAGRAREARQRKVAEMLRLVELESFGDHYRWQLSGGMHQRVSIAEAVFLSARVVVMSPRPGRVADVIAIDLALPRNTATREDPRFFEHVTRVRQALHLGGEREQEPVA